MTDQGNRETVELKNPERATEILRAFTCPAQRKLIDLGVPRSETNRIGNADHSQLRSLTVDEWAEEGCEGRLGTHLPAPGPEAKRRRRCGLGRRRRRSLRPPGRPRRPPGWSDVAVELHRSRRLSPQTAGGVPPTAAHVVDGVNRTFHIKRNKGHREMKTEKCCPKKRSTPRIKAPWEFKRTFGRTFES